MSIGPEVNVSVCSEPAGDGSPPMCVLFEEEDECLSFEPMTGAIALTDIKACKKASLTAITDQAVDLKDAPAEDFTVGGTTAKALEGVAAVGEPAAYDLTMETAEECLAACALWIPDCTHVTVGMLQFHNPEILVEWCSACVLLDLFRWKYASLGQDPARNPHITIHQ